MSLALLERDVQILKFIAKFGFCQDSHIIKLCNLTAKYYLKVIRRLVDGGYIKRNKVLAYEEAYLMLTNEGARFLGVSAPKKLVLNTLYHDTLLIDLYFQLLELYPNSHFRTDKEIRREYGIYSPNDSKRVPDILIDDAIAIELELSEKPIAKLKQIVNSYILNNDILQVHYFIHQPRIYNRLYSLVLAYSKFSFFMLDIDNKNIVAIEKLSPPSQPVEITSSSKGVKKFGGYTYS